MPFANGENVGAYRIVEKLGQGGMATVFKAYHPALDRYVAIKVLHPAFTEDPNFLARFRREARIVAKLDHPHIVPIYDFAEHRGHPYLVMRFIEGETLKARLQRGPLDLPDVLRIVRAVGEALTYAHEQGVLHRDIKPSNILLTPEGGVYLTDFGLARMAEAGESTISRDMMAGTPQYISPEQAKGLTKLDTRTDIYSLGVVLYELLVGRVPFQADTPYAIIHDHIFTPLPLPRTINPDLPEPLERVLLKALAKEPDDRFQSVKELVAALEAAVEPAPAPSPPEAAVAPPSGVPRPARAAEEPEEGKPKKKRRRLWVVAGVAALLCCLGLLVLSAIREGNLGGPRPDVEAKQLLDDARTAQEQGDSTRALDLYRQAVEADPHLVPAYLEASSLLVKTGEGDQAMDFLLEGLEANPDSPELHQRAVEVAALTEQWDQAQPQVEWMLLETPDDPLSHAYAALLALAQGKPCEEARSELDVALQLAPDLAWAHYGLALCYLQEDNLDAARAELKFVLEQGNISPILRIRTERRLTVLDLGMKRAIEREFEALFSLAPEVPEEGGLRGAFKEMLDRARVAWERGNPEEAIPALQDTRVWVQEHWDDLGDRLAGELSARLDRIIRLATGP